MMDKNELSITFLIMAFLVLIFGCIFGIALNFTGFTHINVTSWRYWLGFSSLLIPMFTMITLNRYNISLTSFLGRVIFFYACCVMNILFTTSIMEKTLDWWTTLVYMTIFAILYPILLLLAEHPWVKSKVDGVKNSFWRK